MTTRTTKPRKTTSLRGLFGAAAAVLLLTAPGCSFIRLREDLDEYAKVATVQGTVARAPGVPLPFYVGIVSRDKDGTHLRAYDVLTKDMEFSFKVLPGTYTVIAFHDANGDQSYQPGEPAGGLDSYFAAAPGSTVKGLTLTVVSTPPPALAELVAASAAQKHAFLYVKNVLGKTMDFSSANFSRESASVGFWEPLHFLMRVESGIYFVEPYDPKKMPVLFVHGANGTPLDFQTLTGRLDTKHCQAWLAYYPSGMDLDISAAYLKRSVMKLQQELGFHRMAVVAHSMGGLVARRMLLDLAADGQEDLVPVFVSISSPFNGHVAAGLGVERSPAVVPSWQDIAPGSPFLAALYENRLPKQLRHTLLFGYLGKTSFIMANNDGVVELSSVLRPEAQAEARLVRGYNADHVGILQLPEAAAEVNEALERGW